MTNQDLADKIHTHPRCGKYKCEQYVLTVEVISQARADGFSEGKAYNSEVFLITLKHAKQEAYEHCAKICEVDPEGFQCAERIRQAARELDK